MRSQQQLMIYVYTLLCTCVINESIAKRLNDVKPKNKNILIGGSANITCTINSTKDGDSSTLYFIEDGEQDPTKRMPQEDIVILDPYTIVYTLHNATEQDRRYKCMKASYAIGITHISVGTPPLDIEDFRCYGYDYTYFVCNFTKPRNMVPVSYNVSYTANVPNYKFLCKLKIDETYGICNLTIDTFNGFDSYSRAHEYFNFTVVSYNALGSKHQSFLINNYDSVIPPRLEFQVIHRGSDNVTVQWTLKNYGFYRDNGFEYEVRIKPDNLEWLNLTHSNYDIHPSNASFKLVVRKLPYAYYWYTMRIRARVKSKHTATTVWNEPYEERFQTLGMLPELAPLTDVGSFYIGSSETTVRLYWQQLALHQENGAHFEYVVSSVKRDGVPIDMQPTQIDRISATFEWNPASDYEFIIQSKNEVGLSFAASRIHVPRRMKNGEQHSPKWLRNVYNASSQLYTFSWKPPNFTHGLIDYTVFYCPSKRANTIECQGSMRFEHLHKANTSFNTSSKFDEQNTLNFAVSANYANAETTGMHWTMCAVDSSSDLIKLEPDYSTPYPRSVLVRWNVDRVCKSLIEGYNLTFCEVDKMYLQQIDDGVAMSSIVDVPCLKPNETIVIDKMETKYLLRKLMPYTLYKLQIFMYSKERIGQSSDPKYITTNEEAPTPPLDVNYFNLTSNSVSISWQSPAHFNGRIKHYRIIYNNAYLDVNCLSMNSSNVCHNSPIQYKIKNLSSYTNYSVNVSAYTVAYSLPSSAIAFRTQIGVPSRPRDISFNNAFTIIKWTKPEVPAGLLEFYEVNFAVLNNEAVERQSTSIIMGANSCSINRPPCSDPNYKYTIGIRAVNVAQRANVSRLANASQIVIGDDKDLTCVNTVISEAEQIQLLQRYGNAENYVLLKSEWNSGLIYACAAGKFSPLLIGCLIFFISILITAVLVYGGFLKIRDMRNIKITFPEGLNSSEMFSSENEKLYQSHNSDTYQVIVKANCNSNNIYRNDNNAPTTNSNLTDRSSGYDSSNKSENDNAISNGNDIGDDNDITATYMVMQKSLQPHNAAHDDYTRMDNIPAIVTNSSGYVNPNAIRASHSETNNGYINNWSRLLPMKEAQTANAAASAAATSNSSPLPISIQTPISMPTLIAKSTAMPSSISTPITSTTPLPPSQALPLTTTKITTTATKTTPSDACAAIACASSDGYVAVDAIAHNLKPPALPLTTTTRKPTTPLAAATTANSHLITSPKHTTASPMPQQDKHLPLTGYIRPRDLAAYDYQQTAYGNSYEGGPKSTRPDW